MGVKITHISTYLPSIEVSNEEIANLMPGWSASKISNKLGIDKRFVAEKEQTALDLAVEVCRLINSKIDLDEIDGLILCTQSPEYFLPTTSCILQDRIGLKKSTACFDFNLGCSGYIYGLAIAKGLISSGILRNILFVTSETYSKYIDTDDGSNRALFGDASTVSLLSISDSDNIGNFSLGTDGSGYQNLIVKNGGAKFKDLNSPMRLYMNGPEIFSFTNSMIPKLVVDTLKVNNLTMDEIDYFVFHQANRYMLEHLRNKLGISTEKFLVDMSSSGNTVSNTIPIVLEKIINKAEYANKNVMIVGFGVGYSWGGTVLKL
jgi:3-oxoacyl-[acyl-carrier-protein] synthase-3